MNGVLQMWPLFLLFRSAVCRMRHQSPRVLCARRRKFKQHYCSGEHSDPRGFHAALSLGAWDDGRIPEPLAKYCRRDGAYRSGPSGHRPARAGALWERCCCVVGGAALTPICSRNWRPVVGARKKWDKIVVIALLTGKHYSKSTPCWMGVGPT